MLILTKSFRNIYLYITLTKLILQFLVYSILIEYPICQISSKGTDGFDGIIGLLSIKTKNLKYNAMTFSEAF